MKSTTKSNSKDYFKKIAINRGGKGSSWHKNMLAGRRDAQLNPSLIRLARLRRQLHQSVIANRLNLSESTYGAVERGKRLVDEVTARKTSDLLGVPMTKLFKSNGKKFVAVIPKSVL